MQKYYRALTKRPPPDGMPHDVLVMLSRKKRPCRADLVLSAHLTSSSCIVAEIMPCVSLAGGLVHYVTTGVREKGLPTYTLVHASQVKGSLRCELEILSVQQVQLNASVQALGWPETAYESLIHLKTGRTHQVGHTGTVERG